MSGSAQTSPPHDGDNPSPRPHALVRRPASPLPPILPAGASRPGTNVPFPQPVDSAAREYPAHRAPKNGVLRGLKDLQQLQRQTLAVLESVRGSLDDIQQVLRSPEATRGMEKQKNAATLLAKGFPRDATEQAAGAVTLLPANPDAHLLLALSLAADQQFDAALAATRKGLALVDRRCHPLAIEAGLLHTLAALGNSPEAVERWAAIIDALPLPVLLEQTARIAVCFPAAGDDNQNPQAPLSGSAHLDILLSNRLTHAPEPGPHEPQVRSRRQRLIDTAPGEIPAASLLAGLDAADEASLPLTRRAILGQAAHRLRAAENAADVLRFLTECVVPLGNRSAPRTAASLGRSAVKRLLFFQADAPTLFRAMGKLELAGAMTSAQEIASLLLTWRKAGRRAVRARRALLAALGFFFAGIAVLGWIVWRTHAGISGAISLWGLEINPITIGPAMMGVGVMLGLFSVLTPGGDAVLPEGRAALSQEELCFLRSGGVGQSLRTMTAAEKSRRKTVPAA